jgi:hypothetical protein
MGTSFPPLGSGIILVVRGPKEKRPIFFSQELMAFAKFLLAGRIKKILSDGVLLKGCFDTRFDIESF